MNVLVCCGARGDSDSDNSSAWELGNALAIAGYGVFHGGGYGLMQEVAEGALAGNRFQRVGTNQVQGVSLRSITDKKAPPSPNTIACETLFQRKQFMLETCKAAVILPGGVGTLDELFELACAKKLGHWNGPIVIINLRGFWDHLLAQLRTCIADGYYQPREELFTVVETVDEAIAALSKGQQVPHATAGSEE